LAKVHGEVKRLLISVNQGIAPIAGLERATVPLAAQVVTGLHVLDDEIPDRAPIGFGRRGLLGGGGRYYPVKPVNIVKRLADPTVDAKGVENTA
jgi:hypothetical protein